MKSNRNLEKWNKENIEYSSLDDFIVNFQLKTAIHTVWVKDCPIDILLDYTPGKPAIFIWKGNTARNESIKLPVFNGFRMVKADDASRISISDPTMGLDPNLGLAWYAGNKEYPFQSIVASIVEHIGKTIDTDKIIHFGGSGGGFATLYFSTFNPGSLAIPLNPQVDFLLYEKSGVQKYLNATQEGISIEQAQKTLNSIMTHDVTERYSSSERNNYILYLQNLDDPLHLEKHLPAFLNCLDVTTPIEEGLHNFADKQFSIYFSNQWKGTHEPPSSAFLQCMSKEILNDDRPFADIVADESSMARWEAAT